MLPDVGNVAAGMLMDTSGSGKAKMWLDVTEFAAEATGNTHREVNER